MNPIDERSVRQRLRADLGSLEISPVPATAVTRRGKAIRARRRAVAGGCAAVVAVAVLVGRSLAGPGPAPVRVTVNTLSPKAPGGVFASGTADGKPWRLAVRNIAADPGTRWCLPAVMFNGRDGDVLFKTGPNVPSFGNPALLSGIPGFAGVSAIFTQVPPQVDRLVATFPSGRQLSVRPVRVSACGQQVYLAGFAFAKTGRPDGLSSRIKGGPDEALVLTSQGKSLFATTSAGVWANLDKSQADIAASWAANRIGSGTADGEPWHMGTSLGLFGQCYLVTVRDRGQSSRCVAASAPPALSNLARVPVPGMRSRLTGYAGVVSPRLKKLIVRFDSGAHTTVRPVNVAGRAYVAFVVPPGCQVTQLGYEFAGYAVGTGTATAPQGTGQHAQRSTTANP